MKCDREVQYHQPPESPGRGYNDPTFLSTKGGSPGLIVLGQEHLFKGSATDTNITTVEEWQAQSIV
jgi:hypothetical protein